MAEVTPWARVTLAVPTMAVMRVKDFILMLWRAVAWLGGKAIVGKTNERS